MINFILGHNVNMEEPFLLFSYNSIEEGTVEVFSII